MATTQQTVTEVAERAPFAKAHPVTERRGAHPLAGVIQSPHWYALLLRSRHEFVVRDYLIADGFEQLLPVWKETTAWTDRQRVTTRPLFPGYIFARFNAATSGSAILRLRGVVRILGATVADPEPIADEVIANLQRIAATPAAVECCPHVAGSTVRVAKGPFAGVSGVVARTKGATQLVIPVQILGRSVKVQIEAADVEAAS